MEWIKSSFSSGQGNCLEVAAVAGGESIALRDSNKPEGPIVTVASDDWTVFVAGVKAGDFDRI